MINNLIDQFPLLTLIADILLIVFLFYWLLLKNKLPENIKSFFQKNALFIAFIFALLASVGSLMYSEYALYVPCKLCWYQRIFMYPQVIILGLALWKKSNSAKLNAIIMSVIGALIAIYHYLTQRFPDFFEFKCTIQEVDCSYTHGFDYGYITIPVMALTAFIYIFIFITLWKKSE